MVVTAPSAIPDGSSDSRQGASGPAGAVYIVTLARVVRAASGQFRTPWLGSGRRRHGRGWRSLARRVPPLRRPPGCLPRPTSPRGTDSQPRRRPSSRSTFPTTDAASCTETPRLGSAWAMPRDARVVRRPARPPTTPGDSPNRCSRSPDPQGGEGGVQRTSASNASHPMEVRAVGFVPVSQHRADRDPALRAR